MDTTEQLNNSPKHGKPKGSNLDSQREGKSDIWIGGMGSVPLWGKTEAEGGKSEGRVVHLSGRYRGLGEGLTLKLALL